MRIENKQMGNFKTKRNIALLTDCLKDLEGGAERQIFELAKGLDKEKYSVTICSLEFEGKAPSDIIESIGCRLAVFPLKRIYGLTGITKGLRFIKFLRKEKIDILVTYHFGSDIWGTFFARMAKVKTIISNRRDMGFWREKRHVLAYRAVNRWVSKIIVNANAIKQMVMDTECVPADKIEVIHNGVDVLDTRDMTPRPARGDSRGGQDTGFRKSLGIKEDDLVILHVANITAVKGHVYLFHALKEVISEHPNVKLLVAGEDEMGGSLARLAEDLRIGKNINFLGKRKDVSRLLNITDICVLPSLSEGMSNAILEYMTAGKPVIATDVGGNPELIEHGVNGLLVKKEDKDDLKEALLTLIEDPDKRFVMGQNGFQKVSKEFSMQKMVEHYEQIFQARLSRKKKILHLISSGGLFGAESIVLTLGQNMNSNGVLSVIGAFHDKRSPNLEVLEKARELRVPTFALACSSRFDIGAVFRLKNYLKNNKVDVLHTHNYKSDAIGLLASRMAGIPVVATAHGFTDMTEVVTLYEKLDRWILKTFFSKVVTVAENVLKGFPKQKKHVIPNGLDISKFSLDKNSRANLRKDLNIREGDILVGTIGRFSKEKNQMMLLKAMAEIMRNNRQVKTLIVGDGPERKKLMQFIDSNRLSHQVILTGIMKDIGPVYQALDVFVLSSITEGMPLTILEAMASKCPVIATRVGGIPDMINDEETGLLVDAQDTDALKVRIEYLIENQANRLRLAESAFAYVKANYSVKQMCDSYRQVYQEVSEGIPS